MVFTVFYCTKNICLVKNRGTSEPFYKEYREKPVIPPVDLDTRGGGWTKILLRGDLRVLSGVPGGFRHCGGGLDVS